MATSEVISTAKKPADLDAAYASALKAMSKLGIKITTKKPDATKVGTAMTTANKPAEFCLVGDKGIIKMQVQTKDFSSVLGILDTNAEKDAATRLIIIESLVAAKLMSAADLKTAKAAMPTVVDPTVLKNYKKRKSDYEAQIVKISALTIERVLGNSAMRKEFRAYAVSEHSTENIDFVTAVENKVAPAKIITDFISPSSPNQINLPSNLLKDSMAATTAADLTPAYKNIVGLLRNDLLPRFVKLLHAPVHKQISKLVDEAAKAGITDL